MLKLSKCVIIILLVKTLCVLQVFNLFAAPATLGPGEDLPENPNWRISSTEYLGSDNVFWASWVPIHFGVNIDARLKPGDNSGSDVIYVDRTEGRMEGAEAVKGYGLYQFILEKHMVGYLYFIKNLVNDTPNTSIVKTPGIVPIPPLNEYYKPREACKYVADQLMSSAYSVENQNLLHTLLKDIVNQNSADDIKDWQSNYWYKAFGSNAFTLLNNMGASNIIGGHERDTRGVVLSIMSDRYRNKSLKNKTNLRLNVDKGDLWPFLVYTKSIDGGVTTTWKYDDYKVGSDGKKIEHTTTWDDLIRGAYYYMVYYEYKYDYEGDIELDEDVIYNSTKAEMFVREYEELTGRQFVELTGEALDDFYQKIRTIRRIYKKSTDNGALFGEEEDYSINSDVTYSQAMNNIKRKMEQPPFNKIFGDTLSSDHVARTYLMAKNIAENHRLTNQNAQYDIGSNILQRTPGGNDNTILLTDLQKIKLNRADNGTFPDDADKDGILDGNEMGTYKRVDITGFVEYMLKAESGLSDVSTLMENYKNNIRTANADARKRNLVESQKDIDVVNDRIIVYLMSYTSNPIMKDTDFDGIDDGLGYQDRECTVFVNKNAPNDPKPKDNKLEGKVTMASGTEFDVETHMDYRYFFMDEYNYYDELAEMSLILSQSIYNRNNTNLTNLNTLNEKIGARLISRYLEADDDEKRSLNNYDYKTNYAIGHKYVEYSKDNSANNYIKKMIIPIAIPGMTSISDARSYGDIGEIEWTKNAKIGEEQYNVKSYEVYAEMIKYDIDDYIRENHLYGDYKRVYWITGYKEGGAIANILAAKLRDMGATVYAYTFGSPMTIYNNPDEPGYTKTGYSARYDCIFNVVNEDDAYAYMMPQSLGFSRYGMTCFASGKEKMSGSYNGSEEVRKETIETFNKIYKNKKLKDMKQQSRTFTYNNEDYKETFKIKIDSNTTIETTYKTIQDYLSAFLDVINKNRTMTLPKEDVNSIIAFCQRGAKANNIKVFKNKLKVNYDKLKQAGQEDVYYTLAKQMDNADITNVVNLHDLKERGIRVATVSQMDGIHDGTFVNYQELHKSELRPGIGDEEHIINNRVPTYFQTREYWSFLRYGLSTSDIENVASISNTAKMQYSYNDKNYSYGTFYESSCGATSAAMVLSYLYDKTITPVDVRNMMEKHLEFEGKSSTPYIYRSNDGAEGTKWDAVGYKIPKYFNATNIGITDITFTTKNKDVSTGAVTISTNEQKKKILKYLIQGNPIIAITHGINSKYSHASYFTSKGHYIVIAGVDVKNLNDKIKDITKQKGVTIDINNMSKQEKANFIYNNISDDELDDIRIYCEDSAYYNIGGSNRNGMMRKLKISDFESDGKGEAGVDGMFIYSLNSNSTEMFEKSVLQWQYFSYYKDENIDYIENFTPQSFTIYGTDTLKNKKSEVSGKIIGNDDTWRKDAREEHLLEGYCNEDKINDN